jgi:hypothetical protein
MARREMVGKVKTGHTPQESLSLTCGVEGAVGPEAVGGSFFS